MLFMVMEQHPIPQDITGFQFKLIGDMTLRQFGYLAGGAAAAFVFYSLNWHDLVRWPLTIGVFALGAAMAFVPVEERPLDTWIVNFMKAIYFPTQYLWKKRAAKAVSFEGAKAREEPVAMVPPVLTPPNKKQKLEDYLETLPNAGLSVDDLFKKREEQKPPATELDNNYQMQAKIKEMQKQMKVHEKTTTTYQEKMDKLNLQKEGLMKEVAALRRQVKEKKPEPVKVQAPVTPTNAGFPPNIVTGTVKDLSGKVVDNVVVLIKNAGGAPVRALRTNKLGQFMASTPLENGNYTVEMEKEGWNFTPKAIELDGSIMAPLEMAANV